MNTDYHMECNNTNAIGGMMWKLFLNFTSSFIYLCMYVDFGAKCGIRDERILKKLLGRPKRNNYILLLILMKGAKKIVVCFCLQ